MGKLGHADLTTTGPRQRRSNLLSGMSFAQANIISQESYEAERVCGSLNNTKFALGERRLWAAVMEQAFDDLTSPSKKERRKAELFLASAYAERMLSILKIECAGADAILAYRKRMHNMRVPKPGRNTRDSGLHKPFETEYKELTAAMNPPPLTAPRTPLGDGK